jgi:hypothetical protein
MAESGGALLTPSYREYLRGDWEGKESAERMKKKRLRERISKTLVDDIQFLQESIEDGTSPIGYEDIADEIPQATRRKSILRVIVFVGKLAAAKDMDVDGIIQEAQTEIENGRREVIKRKLRDNPESVTISELMEVARTEEAIRRLENSTEQVAENVVHNLDEEKDTKDQ